MGEIWGLALWEVRALARAKPLPLFAWAGARDAGHDPEVTLPEMPLPEHVVNDYQTLRLSLKAHPMGFLRSRLEGEGIASAEDVKALKDGARIRTAGVVLVRPDGIIADHWRDGDVGAAERASRIARVLPLA